MWPTGTRLKRLVEVNQRGSCYDLRMASCDTMSGVATQFKCNSSKKLIADTVFKETQQANDLLHNRQRHPLLRNKFLSGNPKVSPNDGSACSESSTGFLWLETIQEGNFWDPESLPSCQILLRATVRLFVHRFLCQGRENLIWGVWPGPVQRWRRWPSEFAVFLSDPLIWVLAGRLVSIILIVWLLRELVLCLL